MAMPLICFVLTVLVLVTRIADWAGSLDFDETKFDGVSGYIYGAFLYWSASILFGGG